MNDKRFFLLFLVCSFSFCSHINAMLGLFGREENKLTIRQLKGVQILANVIDSGKFKNINKIGPLECEVNSLKIQLNKFEEIFVKKDDSIKVSHEDPQVIKNKLELVSQKKQLDKQQKQLDEQHKNLKAVHELQLQTNDAVESIFKILQEQGEHIKELVERWNKSKIDKFEETRKFAIVANQMASKNRDWRKKQKEKKKKKRVDKKEPISSSEDESEGEDTGTMVKTSGAGMQEMDNFFNKKLKELKKKK